MNTTGKLSRLNSANPSFSDIILLDQTHFPRPWSTKDWEELSWDNHQLFNWKQGDRNVAFALFGLVEADDVAHLLKICVHPSERGSGLAQVFWQGCQQQLMACGAKSIYLEVELPNERAIGFYKKLGFVSLRTIKRYYSDGTDALTMQMII
jgi:ribosomal protein S18 acetylase RimI-like enzyme